MNSFKRSSNLLFATTAVLCCTLVGCNGAREDINSWAKKNSLKKHAPNGIPLTRTNKPIKANYSSCPKGSEIVDRDSDGQPKTCRSATNVIFSATNAFQERFPNGNPKTQLVYSGDSLLRMHWYNNGNPKEEVVYYESQKHGPYKSWHENGTRKVSGHYADGKKNGEFRYWNPAGKLTAQGHYRKDKKQGVWKTSQQYITRETYVAGVLQGNAEYLDLRGQVNSHGTYQNGNKTGKWVFYHTNGKRSSSGSFDLAGQKNGTWKSYDTNGNLERKEFYKNGILSTQPTLASNVKFKGGDTLGAKPPQFRNRANVQANRPQPTTRTPKKRWAPL